jgi:hypothetical protein
MEPLERNDQALGRWSFVPNLLFERGRIRSPDDSHHFAPDMGLTPCGGCMREPHRAMEDAVRCCRYGVGSSEYPPRETSPPSPRRETTRVLWGKEAHSRITGRRLREKRVWSQLQYNNGRFAYDWASRMRRGGFIDADADPYQ